MNRLQFFIENLPEDYAMLAIKACDYTERSLQHQISHIESLSQCFPWCDTREGHDFWSYVRGTIDNKEQLMPLNEALQKFGKKEQPKAVEIPVIFLEPGRVPTPQIEVQNGKLVLIGTQHDVILGFENGTQVFVIPSNYVIKFLKIRDWFIKFTNHMGNNPLPPI